MKDGLVVAHGDPREVVTADLVRTLYGLEADILHAPADGSPVVVPAASARPPRHAA